MLLLLFLACSYTSIAMANDIAIVTHVENTNERITKAEAVNIFMGRFRQYPNGQRAKPYDNNSSKNTFYKKLINKSPAEVKAYWARLIFSGRTLPPKSLKDSTTVIEKIQSDKQAISYIPLNQANESVKILLILKGSQ